MNIEHPTSNIERRIKRKNNDESKNESQKVRRKP